MCVGVETDPPETIGDELVVWLEQTESGSGELPEDLEATVVDAVGTDGTWVLVANFSSRFEPAVFSMDSERGFQLLWAGAASTEASIREHMATETPELPVEVLMCVDISSFVQN